MVDDLDQLFVAEHLAVQQDRMGNGDLVIGERQNEVARRVLLMREALGELAVDGGFDIVDELA